MPEEQSALGFDFEFSKENVWAWYQDNFGLTNEIDLTENMTLCTLVTLNHQQLMPKSQFINTFFNGGESFTRMDYKMHRSIRMGVTEELLYTADFLPRSPQFVAGIRYENIYSLSKISAVTGEPFDLDYPVNYQTNLAAPNGEVNFLAYGGYLVCRHQPGFYLINANLTANRGGYGSIIAGKHNGGVNTRVF